MGRRSKRKKLMLRQHRLLGIELDPQEARRAGLGYIIDEQERIFEEKQRKEAEAKAEADRKLKEAEAKAEADRKKAEAKAKAEEKKKAEAEAKKKTARKTTRKKPSKKSDSSK